MDAIGGPGVSAVANLGAGLCDVLLSACGVAAAHWEDGAVRVRLRVLIARPGLVGRSFLVRVSIPSLDRRVEIRVAPRGKRVVERTIELTVPERAAGHRVLVAVDPTGQVLEARERDNSAVARIR